MGDIISLTSFLKISVKLELRNPVNKYFIHHVTCTPYLLSINVRYGSAVQRGRVVGLPVQDDFCVHLIAPTGITHREAWSSKVSQHIVTRPGGNAALHN